MHSMSSFRKIERISMGLLAMLCLLGLMTALAGCGGGGGGGGGGGATTAVTGYVYQVETGAPPAHAVTVQMAGQSTQTNPANGNFTFASVPVSASAIALSDTADNLGTVTLPVHLTATQT